MKKISTGLRRAAATAVVGTMVSIGSIASAPTASAYSGEATATTAVNIRTGASTSFSRIGVLYPGQRVTAISSSNGWTKVRRHGRTAYIASAYLRASGEERGSRESRASRSRGDSRNASSSNSAAVQRVNTGGSLNRGGSSGLDRMNANAQKVARHVWATQPAIRTMYGVRGGSGDHPAGRAVDVMIPNYRANNALGWSIANYYRAHAREFGIRYIIFDQQIWNIARDGEGWRPMSNRGSDTANHKDHVHINT